MKNKLYYIFVLVTVSFLFASCSGIEEIKVGNIRGVEIKGINNDVLDVEITVPVENPNSFKVKLKDADLTVTNGETLIGTITQMDEIIISGNSSKEYPVHIKVKLANFSNNLFSIYSTFSNKLDMKLSGTIKVRSFPYFRKIKIKDYKLVN